jgi:hypothetical protein
MTDPKDTTSSDARAQAPNEGAGDSEQRRRYPAPMIDLSATEVGRSDAPRTEPPPNDSASADKDGSSGGESNPSSSRSSARPWRITAAVLAGPIFVLVAAVLINGLWSGGAVNDNALAERVARLETALANRPAGDQALADRVAAIDSALKAVAADSVNLNGRVAAAADAAHAARDRADAVARAAASASQSSAPQADDLARRMTALEQSVAGIKTDVAKLSRPTGDAPARLALLAYALRGEVDRGRPFVTELNELKSRLSDQSSLAPLEPFAATGVPTPIVLSRDLTTLAPQLMQATDVPEGGFLSRLQTNAEHLVRIKPAAETTDNDPSSVLVRIELKTGHGDIAGALAEFDHLPEKARAVADTWIKQAQGREAAIEAARKICADALGALVATQ